MIQSFFTDPILYSFIVNNSLILFQTASQNCVIFYKNLLNLISFFWYGKVQLHFRDVKLFAVIVLCLQVQSVFKPNNIADIIWMIAGYVNVAQFYEPRERDFLLNNWKKEKKVLKV